MGDVLDNPEGFSAEGRDDLSWKCKKRRTCSDRSGVEWGGATVQTGPRNAKKSKVEYIDLDDVSSLEPSDEEDCTILDENPFVDDTQTLRSLPVDEEVELTKEIGPVACRDFPHARSNCAIFLFSKSRHHDYCKLCHCYVCDVAAPCSFWGDGSNQDDHCHANEKDEFWRNRRMNSKDITKTLKCLDSVIQTIIDHGNHGASLLPVYNKNAPSVAIPRPFPLLAPSFPFHKNTTASELTSQRHSPSMNIPRPSSYIHASSTNNPHPPSYTHPRPINVPNSHRPLPPSMNNQNPAFQHPKFKTTSNPSSYRYSTLTKFPAPPLNRHTAAVHGRNPQPSFVRPPSTNAPKPPSYKHSSSDLERTTSNTTPRVRSNISWPPKKTLNHRQFAPQKNSKRP